VCGAGGAVSGCPEGLTDVEAASLPEDLFSPCGANVFERAGLLAETLLIRGAQWHRRDGDSDRQSARCHRGDGGQR
jgi:hypothetical protein